MGKIDWRLAVRALAGFLVGLALWAALTPLYDRAVAATAVPVLHAFEDPNVTTLTEDPAHAHYFTVDRKDFDPRSRKPGIQLRDLTFNFILLTALFAVSKRTFSDRNIGGFVVAVVLLFLTHVVAATTEVMAIYVSRLGPWSMANYGAFARNFWGVANHSYRIVLMYAIAFALWWVFRDHTVTPAKKKKRR